MTQDERNVKRGEKLAKVIARSGICSRREAERLIEAGRVAVNGFIETSPAVRVGPEDEVLVDGAPLPEPEPVRLWRYHKPVERVVARHDPRGRPTIYDDLGEEVRHAMPVGRLDFMSEGLLLLTNDGELKRALEHPSKGWTRRYRVRAYCPLPTAKLKRQLKQLERGIVVDGVHYGAVKATLDREEGANKWFTFALREGKNREIRRILEHLGCKVNRLIRTSYGPFQLGGLKRGEVAEVPRKQLEELLGGLLAKVEERRMAAHPRGEMVYIGFDDDDEDDERKSRGDGEA